MDINNWSPTFFMNNTVDCLNYIKENYQMVPYLNINRYEHIPSNSLVRFRGMVQDMFDPEYYLEKCIVINNVTNETCSRSGKFADTIKCDDKEFLDVENKSNISNERQTFVVVSIPGLNDWVNEIEKSKLALNTSICDVARNNVKRPLENEDDTIHMETSTNQNKKLCSGNNIQNRNHILSREYLFNLPIPEESGKTCHLKIYDTDSNIKLNEVYDFVGFLSEDFSTLQNEDDDLFNEMEIQAHNPPSSLIPRIHCIFWNKVKYENPLLEDISMNVHKITFLKNELRLILTEVMMGDELAADYLLLHLLSKVYLRRELLPLGSFTLNISNIPVTSPEEYGNKLYNLIQLLLPKSHYLPMTLENMNDLSFIPKKDYNSNRLTSGLLQLSEGTHLVLDETKLAPGKLNESGVKAVSVINNIIKHQKVPYDFTYYNMEFECDIPVLILSEGKSLLPSDSQVILKPIEMHVRTFSEIYDAVNKLLNPTLLNDLRVYLSIARDQQYEISSNMLEMVENDFVSLRQTHNITANDLHHLLVLARLICLSEGKSTLDETCWRTAYNLEVARKARF